MSTEDNKALVNRAYEGFNQRTLAVFNELCALDLVFHNASTTIKGLEASMQVLSMLLTAFPDARFTVEDMIAEGDKIVARYTLRGSHQGNFMGIPATGRDVSIPGIEILRFEDGMIAEHWGIYDFMVTAQEVGAKLAFKSSEFGAVA